MALAALRADEQGIILGQLLNALEPRLAVYFSSASSELRLLLTQALLQQLRADHEVATALCRKMGMRSCKELREAKRVQWHRKGISAADLTTLGTLGSVLPALNILVLGEPTGAAGPDGVQRLAERLGAGALPAVSDIFFDGMHVGGAGSLALAAALGRGALPRLKGLSLTSAAIGDAGLVALAPALRQLPALQYLFLNDNPFGDEGIAALVAPPPPAGAQLQPPAGAPPPPTGVLTNLFRLDLRETQIADAGCAALVAALRNGTLPALEQLDGFQDGLIDIPASAAAIAGVSGSLAALPRPRRRER
eukprot:scaffold105044_cov60-Phaeocystis_antarctica.AAC.1